MSSSSNGSRIGGRARERRVGSRATCYIEDPAGKWTSWSTKNPGRRFIDCPNFRDKDKDCKYFDWVDPPLPSQWYKDMLLEFHFPDNQPFSEDYMEQPSVEAEVCVPVQGFEFLHSSSSCITGKPHFRTNLKLLPDFKDYYDYFVNFFLKSMTISLIGQIFWDFIGDCPINYHKKKHNRTL
ncbi:hypothetical protein LXL04_003258 [Taraxacum kok-saghyz]